MKQLDPYTFGETQTCFGCGPHNDKGWKLHFHRDEEWVVTHYTPEAGEDGPPGILHGGLQATLMDEVAGWALAGLLGCMGLTTRMSVRYYLPIRLGEQVEARARIIEDHGSTVVVGARLMQQGRMRATAKLSFSIPNLETSKRVLGEEMSLKMAHFLRER